MDTIDKAYTLRGLDAVSFLVSKIYGYNLHLENRICKKSVMPEKSFAISEREVEILARRLLPEIKKFFANEEIKKEFEKWKAEREYNNQTVETIE